MAKYWKIIQSSGHTERSCQSKHQSNRRSAVQWYLQNFRFNKSMPLHCLIFSEAAQTAVKMISQWGSGIEIPSSPHIKLCFVVGSNGEWENVWLLSLRCYLILYGWFTLPVFSLGQTDPIYPAKVSFEGEAAETENSTRADQSEVGRRKTCQRRRLTLPWLSLWMWSGR